MHPEFRNFLVRDRIQRIQQEAITSRPLPPADQLGHEIVIRKGTAGDERELEELALLEGRELPSGSFLVAEVDGKIAAAMPLDDDAAPLADPFRRSAELVDLLSLRARQIRRTGSRWARPAGRPATA